jgi:phage terminase large subunit
MAEVEALFPAKLEPLFKASRYKVIRGGRGSGKSWGVARALLIEGLRRPLRILCTRETQKSIRDSVHKLLVDQIARLGLAGKYQIQQVQITGVNGTEFIFAGLSDLTAESIKSFEGADIVWVEEGQSVSQRSWQILVPTIRKEKSEIWVTFNPELDNDPTWERFVEHPQKGTIEIEMNWRDNPWFSEVLENERAHDEVTLKRYEYEWIWEGKCKPAITGAIYADELAAMYAERRIGEFPVDASQRVYAVFDLGWNDKTAIGVCQKVISQLRVIDYIEDDHKTPDYYSNQLRTRGYEVSEIYLPHDGDHANWQTGQSGKRVYEDLGWRVNVLPLSPVEDGIKATRTAMRSMFINAEKCAPLIDHMKRYRRVIPATTGEPSKPMHDQHSHGADMVRYMVQAAPEMGQTFGQGLKLPAIKYPRVTI